MRPGCLVSALFFLLAIGAVIFIVAPVIFAGEALAQQSAQLQGSLLCGAGESYHMESFRESYHRPGEASIRAVCIDARGQRNEVTGSLILLIVAAVVLPSILGVVTLAASTPMRVTWRGPGSTSVHVSGDVDQLTPEMQAQLRRVGLGGVVDLVEQQRRGGGDDAPSVYGMSMGDFNRKLQERPAEGGKSLAQKLQDLAEARDRRHISDEEYETLRKRILDEFGLR